MENQHKMTQGYRDLTDFEINDINRIKTAEGLVGDLWKLIVNEKSYTADGRWMSIAKTHFEEGFSAFVRAVAKPEPRF